MLWIKADYGSGRIKTAIHEAKEFAINNNVGVLLTFNNIEIPIGPKPNEKENKLLELYYQALRYQFDQNQKKMKLSKKEKRITP